MPLPENLNANLAQGGQIGMRKLTLAAAMLFFWSLTAYAQPVPNFPLPIPIRFPELCCQFGTTYGSGARGSCQNVPFFGPGRGSCIQSGGTLTSGPCNADGACGGSTVCCAGVSIGETCSVGICINGPCPGPGIAQVDSCAVATEAACDALSPAGEHATQSFPFTTCTKTDTGSACEGPPPQ